jgi:hypothetical protein
MVCRFSERAQGFAMLFFPPPVVHGNGLAAFIG